MSGVEHKLASDRVKVLGWVPEAVKALHPYRLTVAPLRFGAGLKGKVLSSFTAGLPCVGTNCAMEGLALDIVGATLVADREDGFADLMSKVHSDEELNEAAAMEGLSYLQRECSATAIDTLLARILIRRQ